MTNAILWVPVALLAASCGEAYVPAPNAQQLSAATERGRALAERHDGYYSADYLIYKSADTLDPAGCSVDAVVLGTPLERTRHASFLDSYSARRTTATSARLEAALPNGWLEFVVFAHSDNRKDRRFTERFGAASLNIAGSVVPSASVDFSDPERAVYPRATHDAVRYAATIVYKFDVSAIPNIERQTARFSFSDATGKHFDLPLELGRYD